MRVKQQRDALPGWHYQGNNKKPAVNKGEPKGLEATEGTWGAPAVTAEEMAEEETAMAEEEEEAAMAEEEETGAASAAVAVEEAAAEDEEMEDEDDDGEGWLNPDNIDEVMGKEHGLAATLEDGTMVGCVTTDFAMQNVMLQMGLNVVSVDGMLVKRVKQYVLKCEACFKMCDNMDAIFCPSCGNNTLFKMAINVSESGVQHHEMRKKRYNLRGTKYSIPMPKGGKKNTDLVLREDQIPKDPRHSKELDLMDPDSSWSFNVKKRAGGRDTKVGHGRRNPNEAKSLMRGKNKKR